jgi:hypothetical protein
MGAGIWYATEVIAATPLETNGGGVTGAGVQSVDDGYHVPYASGGTLDVEVFVTNAGHYNARITAIAFPGVATTNDFISPIHSAIPVM